MKAKVIKLLVVSALLSLTMGCVSLANNVGENIQELPQKVEAAKGEITETSKTSEAPETVQPALTKQQQHVVKTYNGQPQGSIPVEVEVSYVNGLEIIHYGDLQDHNLTERSRFDTDSLQLIPLNNNYFYNNRESTDEEEYRIIDRYGNVFMKEKIAFQPQYVDPRYTLYDIKLQKKGMQNGSFFLHKTEGNFNHTFYWYDSNGELIAQLPGVYSSEKSVDPNDSEVRKEVSYATENGYPILYGRFYVVGIMEGVLILRESFVDEREDGLVDYYYDLENDFKLIAKYYTTSLGTFYRASPTIKNGICYVPEEFLNGENAQYKRCYLEIFDDSRIKFASLDSVIKKVDENFVMKVSNRCVDMDSSYIFQPSDNGWVLGEGSDGFAAYNIHTGKIVTYLPWNEFKPTPSGGYPCRWWSNTETGQPYEFEKDGLMIISRRIDEAGERYNTTALSVLDLNAGKRINDVKYDHISLYDYHERPIFYRDIDGQEGYLNDNFEIIANYKDCTGFSYGYALVSTDGWNFSVINEKFEVVAENVAQGYSASNLGYGLYALEDREYHEQYKDREDYEKYYFTPAYRYVYVGPQ